MAKNEWIGNAAPVADVWTITLATTATGSGTVTATVEGKDVAVAVANGETPIVVAARLGDALAASTIPEVLQYAWTYVVGGTVVTGTYKTPGVPGNVSVADTVSGMTSAAANPTVATGPNFGNNVQNWSLTHLPGTGGEEVEWGSGPGMFYGFSGMWGGTPSKIRVLDSYTAGHGLPRRNLSGGGSGYIEWRPRFVDFIASACPEIRIGEAASPGSNGAGLGLGRYLVGSGQKILIYKTGASTEDGAAAVDIAQKTTDAPDLISVFGGSVSWGGTQDVGANSADLATVTDGGSLLAVGPITELRQRSGTVYARGYIPTVGIQDGTYIQQDGRVDAITADGGTVRLQHDQGTNVITAVFRGSVAGEPPVLDLTDNDRTGRKIARGSSFTGGAFILDPYKTANLDHVLFDQQSFQASIIGRTVTVSRAADGYIITSMNAPLGLQATTLAASGNGQGVSFDGYSMELTAVQVASNDLSAATSTLVTKLQEADTLGGSYTDIPGAVFSGIGHADIQPHAEAITFKRTKEFIRPVFTVTGGSFDIFTVGLAIGQ